MAKVIGYYEDNPPGCYDEGPFVVCKIHGKGYSRIENECPGHKCSVLPWNAVMHFIKRMNRHMDNCGTVEQMVPICDQLNKLFREGKLVRTAPNDFRFIETEE